MLHQHQSCNGTRKSFPEEASKRNLLLLALIKGFLACGDTNCCQVAGLGIGGGGHWPMELHPHHCVLTAGTDVAAATLI